MMPSRRALAVFFPLSAIGVEEMTADHNPQWSAPVRLVERLVAVP
jgi:hypothetical protein